MNLDEFIAELYLVAKELDEKGLKGSQVEIVLPQVGEDINGDETFWDAKVSDILVVEKDGKWVIKIQ